MIPMIDLLMCMISFLLITAVWSTMSRINADAQVPGPPNPDKEIDPNKDPDPMLHVTVQGDEKFILAWKKGQAVVSTTDVPIKPAVVNSGSPDEQVRYPDLAAKIKTEWEANGAHRNASDKKIDQAVVHCDNKTPYKEIIAVIDAIYAPQREFPGGGAGKTYPAMNVTFSSQ